MDRLPGIKIFSKNKLFLIISSLILILLFIIELINGRFFASDFEVYYYAAKSLFAGDQVYGVAFGNSEVGFYKYSPFTLLLYVPASFLPFQIAAGINYFFLSAITIAAILVSCYLIVEKYFNEDNNLNNTLLLITFFLSLTFLARDMRLGNTNILLLFIICMALVYYKKSPQVVSGLLLAIAILFKPYILIVITPMLAYHKFKSFMYVALFTFILMLIPFLFAGCEGGINLYEGWFHAILNHNSYIISPFTIDSLIKKHLLTGTEFDFSGYIIAVLCIGYIGIHLVMRIARKHFPTQRESDQFFLLETFSILALIPNIVNTDTQQFLFSIPLIAFLIQYMLVKRNYYLLILYIILFFFFSVDQDDLIGKSLSQLFKHNGLRGISNLFIIGLSWFIFINELKSGKVFGSLSTLKRTGGDISSPHKH